MHSHSPHKRDLSGLPECPSNRDMPKVVVHERLFSPNRNHTALEPESQAPAEKVSPRKPEPISTVSPQVIPSTPHSGHFRDPVPAAINRVQPFHAENPGPVRQRVRDCGDPIQLGPPTLDQRFRSFRATGGGAQSANVVEYLVERFRRQPKNLRLAGKRV